MNIQQYFGKINSEVQTIYSRTIQAESARIATVHSFACDLHEFSDVLSDINEKQLIEVAISQFELSALEMCFGLYRQSFSSMRRAYELSLAVIYFSLNKLEHHEWLTEAGDINWRTLIDEHNGVLSTRVCNAFWPQLAEEVKKANGNARSIYRDLSQFVHGNKETWDISGIKIIENKNLIEKYFKNFNDIVENLCIAYCVRYVNGFSASQIDETPGIAGRLQHISIIRQRTGGPKDI